MANEIIEFNGKRYYLNSGSLYYTAHYDDKNKKGGSRLHRDVWEYYSGEKVPKGYEVHHIDGNKLNNNYENLICISIKEHRALHKEQIQDVWKTEKMINASAKGREKCKEWHKSEEGKKWHSEHQKAVCKKNIITKICPDCGREFNTWKGKKEQYICRKCRDKYLKRKLYAERKVK